MPNISPTIKPKAAASIPATTLPTAAPPTPPLAATPVEVAIVRSGVDIVSPFVVGPVRYPAARRRKRDAPVSYRFEVDVARESSLHAGGRDPTCGKPALAARGERDRGE